MIVSLSFREFFILFGKVTTVYQFFFVKDELVGGVFEIHLLFANIFQKFNPLPAPSAGKKDKKKQKKKRRQFGHLKWSIV